MNTKKYCLVTGATGGLGTAFCKEFLKLNKNLIVIGRNVAKLQKLKKELSAINPNVDIVDFVCDFGVNDDMHKLSQFLMEKNFNIDYLVNNAGCIIEGGIKTLDEKYITNCIKVNCESTILLTKCVIDQKNAEDILHIITISSLASNYPMPYMALYSATKSLLSSYFMALGQEYKKDNIKVLVVEPGAIDTSPEMKLAIQAQGLKGKLSTVDANVIAKNSIKNVNKNKISYIPGFFNKFTKFVSAFVSKKFQMKFISKTWQKSQKKRNIN